MLKVLPSDQLLSYQLLFIKDVKTAKLHSRNPTIYETRNKRLFQKVRLSGIIVSEQHNHSITEVDDSTDTIQVHISSRLFKREDSDKIKKAVSATIIGEPIQHNNTMIIICNGYQIETCLMSEVEHWLNVMKSNKDKKWLQHQPIKVNKLIKGTNDITNDTDSNDHDQKRQKIATKEGHPNLFNSLSSQPSPIRGSIEEFLFSSPPQPFATSSPQKNQTSDSNQLDLFSSSWHWSPDHIVATSTPIKQRLKSSSASNSPFLYRSSPLNDIITNKYNLSFDDDDDFGFDDSAFGTLDLGDLERKALEQIKKE
ncbi:hypothetical protein BJ944DRAFT_239855 [Cunninghamella echinulata]|nr:hypothetical protein BJ944DRAFT_239855 [Cunninghamella echinulata]